MPNLLNTGNEQEFLVPLTSEWLDTAKIPPSARAHLFRSLKGLVKAMAPTSSFPLYGSTSVEIIKKFLDSIDWKAYDLPPGWKEYEYDRLKKFGPQGGHPSWDEIYPLFMLYATRPAHVRCVNPDSMTICKAAIKAMLDSSNCAALISPLAIDESLATLLSKQKIFETAAGCRRFDLKKTDPLAQDTALRDIKTGLFEVFRMYIAERYNKQKPRIFMVGPFSNMIEQASFLVPVMDLIQADLRENLGYSSVYHFGDKIGFDPLFHQIMAQRASLAVEALAKRVPHFNRNKVSFLYIQGDFEKMDTTTGPSQYQHLYFPIIGECFSKSDRVRMERAFIKTTTMPVISPSGVMICPHGTGSGMENTNNGETFPNFYYGTETLRKFSLFMKKYLPHVAYEVVGDWYNGDDSTFVLALYEVSSSDIEQVKKYFQLAAELTAEECGFRINDKWRMDTGFGLYCQNGYVIKIINNKTCAVDYMYPAALILNSIINPEHQYSKSDWDKDYRDIDIIEKLDNGRYLPYFHNLIKFVDNGMKYRLLRHSERETARILSKYGKYKSLQKLSEMYNRQDYNIYRSPTVKYVLTELRSTQ